MQEECQTSSVRNVLYLKDNTTFMSGKQCIAKVPILSKAISTLDVIIQIPKGFNF